MFVQASRLTVHGSFAPFEMSVLNPMDPVSLRYALKPIWYLDIGSWWPCTISIFGVSSTLRSQLLWDGGGGGWESLCLLVNLF